jgi:hypothetical protein
VDIVEEENEEFYKEILVFVDKHHHVIPLMDILDRITIKMKIEKTRFFLKFLQIISQVVIIFPIVMIDYYSFERYKRERSRTFNKITHYIHQSEKKKKNYMKNKSTDKKRNKIDDRTSYILIF